MTWFDVLKAKKGGSWTTKNLPMLKNMVEKTIQEIPTGAEFISKDWYSNFLAHRPELDTGNSLAIYNGMVNSGKLKDWFMTYFTRYVTNRGHAKFKEGKKTNPAKMIRV